METEKRKYCIPIIEQTSLDNEISLILASGGSDPGEPGASLFQAPEYFNKDIFKTNQA